MMPHPVGLSQDQLRIVTDAARVLPHEWRSRYLAAVVDRLLAVDVVVTDDVECASAWAVERMVGVSTAAALEAAE